MTLIDRIAASQDIHELIELLNEVISQGDTAQQNEAKQMLAALG